MSFRGEEALTLARQGKEAWNAWAEANPGRVVNFGGEDFTVEKNKAISFEGFTFPGHTYFPMAKFLGTEFNDATFEGGVLFTGARFKSYAGFSGTTFQEDTRFGLATFKEGADFEGATFEGKAGFGRSTFKGNAEFTGAEFTGPVDLDECRFQTVPDLRGTDFKKHLTLHGMDVDFRLPTKKTDADKYRRLKELAVNARDHEREQEFYAYELIAKRDHETHGLALVPNYLYEWLSDFGCSLRRPSIGLFGVWLGFGVLYNWIAVNDWSHIWDGLLFSTAQLFPFLGASKGALADAGKALFCGPPFSGRVNALGMLEGGFGILLLFLIGLALRNRFRI